jgi:predicted metal-dependent enzyme (double-stranded beta helix superfamily)
MTASPDLTVRQDLTMTTATTLATGTTALDLRTLPDRYLSQDELAGLVQSLAGQPQKWADQVAHSGGRRHYASLHRDEYVDIWLLCWSPGDDTGWHDHDISCGAVRVVRGALLESNPRIGGQHVQRVVRAGRTFSFGPDHIHRLAGEAERSVSLHAYSPPLWRLGQYSIDGDGVLRRVSVSYADELRPAPELHTGPA